MNRVILSPEYFPNPTIGRPISGAQIFVGIVDLDPEVLANQKQVSVQQESGTIVQVSQPILTGAGGVPLHQGSTVTILVDGDYSLKVLDKNDSQIYYIPSQPYQEVVNNVDDMLGLIEITGQADKDTAEMLGFFFTSPESNPRGGGGFTWQSTLNKNLANGGTIVDPDNIGGFDGTTATLDAFLTAQGGGIGTGCWVRIENNPVKPEQFGATTYTGLHTSELSATLAINSAYQASVSIGARFNLGSLGTKYFMDGEFLIDNIKFDITGGVFEYLAAYSGVAIRVKIIDPTQRLDNDSVWDKFKVQTTLEDDNSRDEFDEPIISRAQKEGQYIGILHDTSSRAVFNVRFVDYFLQRPLVALKWDGDDGSGNAFSTTVFHERGSYLAYKTCVQVKSTAGIVGDQQLNSPAFLEQRTTPSTLFDIEKGTSFMVNNAFYWNDGDQTSTLFNITAETRISMVVIRGGYWESEASLFLHPQVSIDGNMKITTKPGGGITPNAILFQPQVSGCQTENMIIAEARHWVKLSGATVTDFSEFFQGRSFDTLDGIIRYDLGDEASFAELQNMSFSCWMLPDTDQTAGLAITVNYTDASSDTFNSAFVQAVGRPQLIGVDLSNAGIDAGKTPNRVLITISSGTGTAKVGIPVLNRSAVMPLYSVPLSPNFSKEKYRVVPNNVVAPSIRSVSSYFLKTANTIATTLTDLVDGYVGQELFLLVDDVNTSIDLTNTANFRGHSPIDGSIGVYALANTDAVRMIMEPDGQWYVIIIRSSG